MRKADSAASLPLRLQFFAEGGGGLTAEGGGLTAEGGSLTAEGSGDVQHAGSADPKATTLPEEARRQIEAATAKAHALLLAAEVRVRGAEMGLLDPDMALLAMDRTGVKITGSGEVQGVDEALKALKTGKPYLFGASQKPGAWAAPQGDGAARQPSARDEMKRMLFGGR